VPINNSMRCATHFCRVYLTVFPWSSLRSLARPSPVRASVGHYPASAVPDPLRTL